MSFEDTLASSEVSLMPSSCSVKGSACSLLCSSSDQTFKTLSDGFQALIPILEKLIDFGFGTIVFSDEPG